MSGGGSNRWDVMSIREYTDRTNQTKTQWTKIGVAFTNKNGSINVQLDCLPLDGKVQLQVPLTPEEKERLFGNRDDGGGQQRQQRGGGQPQQTRGGGFGSRQQGNPRNAGNQQRQQAQQRFGQRGQSQPQQGGFAPTPEYQPDPEAADEANYERGWDVNGTWITDARNLPQDHPDYIPF